jgi:hypothetical protein
MRGHVRRVRERKTVKEKTYLGDAVYAQWDRGMLKLTTEDGIMETNTIYLEPEVITALLDYLKASSEMPPSEESHSGPGSGS